jgi:hypothetical protein
MICAMTLVKLACLSPPRLVPQEVGGDSLHAVPKLAAYSSDILHSISSTLFPSCMSILAATQCTDGEVFFLLQYSCFVSELLIFESKTVGLAETQHCEYLS